MSDKFDLSRGLIYHAHVGAEQFDNQRNLVDDLSGNGFRLGAYNGATIGGISSPVGDATRFDGSNGHRVGLDGFIADDVRVGTGSMTFGMLIRVPEGEWWSGEQAIGGTMNDYYGNVDGFRISNFADEGIWRMGVQIKNTAEAEVQPNRRQSGKWEWLVMRLRRDDDEIDGYIYTPYGELYDSETQSDASGLGTADIDNNRPLYYGGFDITFKIDIASVFYYNRPIHDAEIEAIVRGTGERRTQV